MRRKKKNQIKKLVSLLLAVVMMLSLSMSVYAEDTTISVKEGDNRTYSVYQIFTGDLSSGVLSNVKWGKNGDGITGDAVSDTILDTLTAVNSMSDTNKLAKIKEYVNLEEEVYGTVNAATSPLSVPTGYYLIKDNGSVGEGEAYSLYIVKVAGPTVISPKTGTITSEKKVKDTNDSTADSTSDWQDSADYDIGDSVPFQLKATIAEDYANYKVYKLVFHDTESEGLTFDADSVKVAVDGGVITEGYTVATTEIGENETFQVQFNDLKTITSVHAGSVITVEYNSTLNTKATIGDAGNPNTMYVEYSNNPNDEQGSETGTTPEDKVIVFTYKVVVNKQDENDNSLSGADFKLYKKNLDEVYEEVDAGRKSVTPADNPTTFTFSGLDDGVYKLEETATPGGYNSISPIEFTVTAAHATASDDPKLTSLTGTTTKSGEITFASNKGSLTTNVVNHSGSTLPETGGMGTTIFYIVGVILVVGAAVLLIAKRRMNAEK